MQRWYFRLTHSLKESMDKQKQTTKDIDYLADMLTSKDDKLRRDARKLLIVIGKPSIPSLSQVLLNSKVHKARWEAAKALGAINSAQAIPCLVKALEDHETDVAWLAAVALEKQKQAAWPELFRVLIERGVKSIKLRQGTHHVLSKQRVKGFNKLLEVLRKALESGADPEYAPVAAFKILQKMEKHSSHE